MAREAWSADDGKIFISGTYFSSVTGSDFTATVTEVSMAGGERDVDQKICFGSGTNSYMYRKGQTLIEAAIKFHKANNDLWLGVAGGSYITGDPQQWTGGALKYPVRATYDFTDRFDVSGAQFQAVFDNAEVIKCNWSMAVDGTMEGEMSLKCLPHNYTEKYTENRVTGPLT